MAYEYRMPGSRDPNSLSFEENFELSRALPHVLSGDYDPLRSPPDPDVLAALRAQAEQEVPYLPSYKNRVLAVKLVGYAAELAGVDMAADTSLVGAPEEEALARDFRVLTKIIQTDNDIALKNLVPLLSEVDPPMLRALNDILEALRSDIDQLDLDQIKRDSKSLLRIRLLFQQYREEELYSLRGFIKPKDEDKES